MSAYTNQGGWIARVNSDHYLENGVVKLANKKGQIRLGTFVLALIVNDPDFGLLTRFIFWGGVVDFRVRPNVCVLHHHGLCDLFIGGTMLPMVIQKALHEEEF